MKLNLVRILSAAAVCAALAACGNKGPLVLPDKADAEKAKKHEKTEPAPRSAPAPR